MAILGDTWNLPPPPGFRGLREDLPLVRYQRHLPHWRQDGASYFVTFRLDDALPRVKLEYLKRLRAEWERTHPVPQSDEQWEKLLHEITRLTEGWLDEGLGACRLRDPRAATILERALRHFDLPDEQAIDHVGRTSGPSEKSRIEADRVGPEVQPTSEPTGQPTTLARYELGCYVIMPNHVHLIVRPLASPTHSLEKILQSWKTFTAREINALFAQTGTLWQPESFDRIVRDEEHLWQTIQYVGDNPAGQSWRPANFDSGCARRGSVSDGDSQAKKRRRTDLRSVR